MDMSQQRLYSVDGNDRYCEVRARARARWHQQQSGRYLTVCIWTLRHYSSKQYHPTESPLWLSLLMLMNAAGAGNGSGGSQFPTTQSQHAGSAKSHPIIAHCGWPSSSVPFVLAFLSSLITDNKTSNHQISPFPLVTSNNIRCWPQPAGNNGLYL